MHDRYWYDWMVRDFFGYLIGRAYGSICMPGKGEFIDLGAEWLSEAERAFHHALVACNHERDEYQALAGKAWQEIFGSAAPVLVS
jgi:hypothetical protein